MIAMGQSTGSLKSQQVTGDHGEAGNWGQGARQLYCTARMHAAGLARARLLCKARLLPKLMRRWRR